MAVRRHHFRLKPQAEGQALFLDGGNQLLERTAQLLLVGRPVAYGGGGITAFSEPAVIQDKQFRAYARRFRSQGGQGGPVKIKVMGFPAVEQHGPLLFGEPLRNQQVLIHVMKNLGHSAQSLPGIDQHGLRRLERLSRL